MIKYASFKASTIVAKILIMIINKRFHCLICCIGNGDIPAIKLIKCHHIKTTIRKCLISAFTNTSSILSTSILINLIIIKVYWLIDWAKFFKLCCTITSKFYKITPFTFSPVHFIWNHITQLVEAGILKKLKWKYWKNSISRDIRSCHHFIPKSISLKMRSSRTLSTFIFHEYSDFISTVEILLKWSIHSRSI